MTNGGSANGIPRNLSTLPVFTPMNVAESRMTNGAARVAEATPQAKVAAKDKRMKLTISTAECWWVKVDSEDVGT